MGIKIQYWTRVIKIGSTIKILAGETGLDWTQIASEDVGVGDFDVKWMVEVEEPEAKFGFDIDDGDITDIKLGDDHCE